MDEVTRVIGAIDDGDPRAASQLLPVLYDELRKLARARLAQERNAQTLQPTALVHEAYLRVVGSRDGAQLSFDGRGHFFAAAAEAMRRILIENARRKASVKHGGEARRVDAEVVEPEFAGPTDDVLALDEALQRLAAEDPPKAELVKLRYFAGLTLEEAAAILKVSPATADRYWAYAKAWLFRELGGAEGGGRKK